MEPVLWTSLGLTIFVTAPLAKRYRRARQIARLAVGALFLAAGALINLIYLVGDTDYYAGFADASYIPFVRETWRSVVAPDQALFIGALIAFEAVVGVLILSGGRRAQWGLVAAIGFHVALLSFGWFFYAWSLPMVVALVILLRAERAATGVTETGRAGVLDEPAVPSMTA